jgi:hypothetical protein
MPAPRRHGIFPLILVLSFILTACVSITEPTAIPGADYYLVTAAPQNTATPFQPPAQPPATATLIPSLTPTVTPIPTETATLAPTETALPTTTPVVLPRADRPQYAISALLDYDAKTLIVAEDIRYTNNTSDEMYNIVLAVEPNLWGGTFTLDNLTVNDQAANYSLNGQRLEVALDQSFQPGATLKIGIAYSLALPPVNPNKFDAFGYTARQINLANWYPFIVPYQGGWVLHDLWDYGEHLVYDAADYDVYLQFSDPADAPVIAANAPGVIEGDGMRYYLPDARTFVLSASPDYQLSVSDANGVTINSYYFPEHSGAGAMAGYVTQQAIATYSNRFAPYQHISMTVVESTLFDGMEFDGLYFLSGDFYRDFDGSVLNNLGVIAAHETAHMWWFGRVGNDQAFEPWLDEAMAEYSEHIFFEDNYPNWVNWWWSFRVNSKNPIGYVDATLYNSGGFNPYTRAVYHNGARFLQALRDRIGDEAFFAFLNDYALRNTDRIANADDFFSTLREHTTTDFSDLINVYFANAH